MGLVWIAFIHCERGEVEPARAGLDAVSDARESDNSQARAGFATTEARVLHAEGRHADALVAGERGVRLLEELSSSDLNLKVR